LPRRDCKRIIVRTDKVMAASPIRFAILGSNGQLGGDFCRQLNGPVAALTRAQADLTNGDQLRQTLQDVRPEVVINCAAYNLVDRAEHEPEAALAVNAWGVRQLALVCRDLGCVLVHFSTDYVYGLEDGRQTPYRETDAPGPVSVYGLSKLAGEYVVRSLCPKHFVVRTCGLYGAWGRGGKGGNFVETMLRLGLAGKPLRVVHDQVCTPSYSADVAALTMELLQTDRFGLYHITNAGSCSWYEFAQSIFDQANISADLTPISSAQYGAPARRPAYSVLETKKIDGFLRTPRPWKEALGAYLQERSHPDRFRE